MCSSVSVSLNTIITMSPWLGDTQVSVWKCRNLTQRKQWQQLTHIVFFFVLFFHLTAHGLLCPSDKDDDSHHKSSLEVHNAFTGLPAVRGWIQCDVGQFLQKKTSVKPEALTRYCLDPLYRSDFTETHSSVEEILSINNCFSGGFGLMLVFINHAGCIWSQVRWGQW